MSSNSRRRRAAEPVWPGMLPPQRAGRRRAGHRPLRRGLRRIWLVLGLAVAGSVAAVTVVLVYTAAATGPRQSAVVVDPVLGGGPGCEPVRTEQLVRGNGIGGTDSGPNVILAFQHAYYVARSGTVARQATTPDAAVSAADVIDTGIASIPADTKHCVLITPISDGRFDVVVSEIRPDATVHSYRQFVTVTARNGAVLIAKIERPA
ncbi:MULTISPECIES: hypothetical protein [unclassified Nocardia]|uniref:hypothetical protein n=1 Tax=unclassified Nocardia TaxID=2637762 RepID=UPI001CE42C7D|nr:MULTISPECIES: hypothetical protein [unclassified Nocardia]